jgi:glycosyltransferase involved in cell wall biosynthesis
MPQVLTKDRKVVVGSGWWSDDTPHDWTIGTADTHAPAFFRIWLRLVRKYLSPERIVVTDSCSPLKPPAADRDGVEWIELDRNYGHANDIRLGRIRTKHSGFARSVFLGATYALACDADYYVYVEQDCVIRGEGFLDAIVAGMKHPIALGAPTAGGVGIEGPAAPMLQQSLMIVARAGLERFIASIVTATESDGDVPPEIKFARRLKPFSTIAIPFGRSRPLDFAAPHFYAQHLTAEELHAFLALESEPETARAPCAPRTAEQNWSDLIDGASVGYPAVRELLLTWRRRPDLHRTMPLTTQADLDRLIKWALVSGVNEETTLAELASELAEATEERARSVAQTGARVPKTVHLVSLSNFSQSFRNCADTLERELRNGGVAVVHHRQAGAATLAQLTQTGPDEVVHVLGQGDISQLFRSSARNWLLTIHGAAPYSMPGYLHEQPGRWLEALRRNAEELPGVIAPTFNARREISIAYGIPRDRIEPVPHFFDFDVYRPDGDRHREDGRYFLAVSNYQPKKNYVTMFEGFAEFASQLGGRDLLLLVAGETTPSLLKLVKESVTRWPILEGKIRVLGHVKDLAPLYRGAIALVSMSHQEGFGMPYIEAALCHTPVIGPRRSARAAAWASQPTQEILGRSALYADPTNAHSLAVMMEILARDPATRTRMADRCLERAREYVDTPYLLRRYLHVYSKALTRNRK